MKMSKGQIGRRLLGLAVAGLALVASGAAFAEQLGQPAPWEFRLQESASPVMDSIASFHDYLSVLITLITLFVLGLLAFVVVKFNAKANPVPSKTTHNTLIEVAWTLIPVLILVSIAVPSFRLLFEELDIPKADLTVKATGKQRYRRSASRSTRFPAGLTRPGSRPPGPACSTANARNCAAGITPSCRSRCMWW